MWPCTPISGGMAFDSQPKFSPDGQWIVFISDREGSENIWIIHPDGSGVKQVSKNTADDFSSPAWIPDGKYIVPSKMPFGVGANEQWIPRGGTALAERYGNMLRPLPMKATILSHEAVPIGADSSEVHRFTFVLDDGQTLPRSRVISLRTARVLVAELKDADAFVKMLREIVRTDSADFDSLPGQIFTDGDAARPDAEPLQP